LSTLAFQLALPDMPSPSNPGPALRVLSLGAGVQSTTLLLLSAEGILPRLDAAVFADTGWEPRAVYEHLIRLEMEVARPAGIPMFRVSRGHIRNDALTPGAHYAQMPLYVLGDNGSHGMLTRQCTAEYKIAAIKPQVRELLGYPRPRRVPSRVFVEQWIGISSDESSRAARMNDDVAYSRSHFPLLFLPGGTGRAARGWTREDCKRYLRSRGFESTPKSACIGCPFHSNARWRELRDNRPDEWADAVDFDRRIRHGAPAAIAAGAQLHGQAFLHRSRVPLEEAPIDHVTSSEWRSRQTDIFDEIADVEVERGCSPWACRGEDD
jgi:3'-phosphoadenosine 5'-phosphosulfate sulfotransferase (PAPS reductase)/FAD synthetase